MSAQVNEAHRKLVAAIIRDLSIDDGAQLIADSEARAVAAAVTALTCVQHNDKQREECPVCLVVALTAERDVANARAERAEAELVELVAYASALEDQLDSEGVKIARASIVEAMKEATK